MPGSVTPVKNFGRNPIFAPVNPIPVGGFPKASNVQIQPQQLPIIRPSESMITKKNNQ